MDRVQFRTSDGVLLEGELRLPENERRASAVICHPHPEEGGSKDHPLLWAIRNALAARGFAVLSFNFRGVMGSEGTHAGGVDEVEDARAAVDRAREEAAGPTFVAGWSFGANVALRGALEDERVGALALLGVPLAESRLALPALPDREELAGFGRPVLLVAGEGDQFCPVPELRALARRLRGAEVEVVGGTDHFFWKREREVGDLVANFAERTLLRQGGERAGSRP